MRRQRRGGLGFEQFKPVYNRYIQGWLEQQRADLEQAMATTQKELAGMEDPGAMKSREDALAELQSEIEVIDFRLSLGDYFADKNPEDLPEDLVLGRWHG